MGSQKVKGEKQEKPQKKAPKEAGEKVAKKWKGKDWFTVVAPAMFNGREVGEFPATDPKGIVGRRVVLSLADILQNPSKYQNKIRLKVISVENGSAHTRFDGLDLIKEQMFRIVRKRLSKVEVVHDFRTKDSWVLHFKILAMLNRKTDQEVQRKVRRKIVDFVGNFTSKASVEDVVNTVCSGIVQKNIKKFGSPIYPIRFCEVVKIDVRKAGK